MYSFSSRIRYSQTDSEGNLSIIALLDFFQDCSIFHSEELGLGLSYLQKKNLAWVLNSWQIDIGRCPKLGETVEIGTFPYDFKSFLGYRNFFMKDENGINIAMANSVWTLLDTHNMRPARPEPDIVQGYQLSERLDMEYAGRKIRTGEQDEAETAGELIVRKHHIDTNQHVNNGQYVLMAMDYVPKDFTISRLRAEYRKSAVLDDIIYPKIWCKEGIITVSLDNESGETYAIAEFCK